MRLLPFLILLSSCSAQWHFDRAVMKDPSIIQTDTITDTVTIQIPGVTASDSIRIPKLTPCEIERTIPIDQNGVTGFIVINHDVISYELKCPEIDTALVRTVEVKIPCPPCDCEDGSFWDEVKWVLWIILGITFFAFLRTLFLQK